MSKDPARRRLRGFGWHLLAYGIAVLTLYVANRMSMPENPWFIWPMVGWGGVLAIHVAHVMGLFGTAE
jgi:hypothetical protein